jgi:hypothetical protein
MAALIDMITGQMVTPKMQSSLFMSSPEKGSVLLHEKVVSRFMGMERRESVHCQHFCFTNLDQSTLFNLYFGGPS